MRSGLEHGRAMGVAYSSIRVPNLLPLRATSGIAAPKNPKGVERHSWELLCNFQV